MSMKKRSWSERKVGERNMSMKKRSGSEGHLS